MTFAKLKFIIVVLKGLVRESIIEHVETCRGKITADLM